MHAQKVDLNIIICNFPHANSFLDAVNLSTFINLMSGSKFFLDYYDIDRLCKLKEKSFFSCVTTEGGGARDKFLCFETGKW